MPKRDWLLFADLADPERERKIADEKLCLRLLAGYSVDDGKLGFPSSGSDEEWAARAALARVIRDHMKGFTAEFLAFAIDPKTPAPPSAMATAMPTRPVRFIRFDKPRGRAPTILRDLLVVDFIRRERRGSDSGKEDAALKAAESRFGLGKSRTHAIWAEHKERIGELKKKRKPHSTK